jgi:hypothetical protein
MAAIVASLLISAQYAAGPVDTAAADAEQPPAGTAAADRLAASMWQRVGGESGDPSAETETWTFFPTRSFRWSLASDHRMSRTGAWSVVSTVPDSGMVVLVADPTGPGKAAIYQALSFSFPDDRLRLGERLFEARPIPEADTGTVPDAYRLAMAQAPRDHQEFALWTVLTTLRWRRQEEGALNDPDAISFARDGSYQATITSTKCRYSGTWSLTISGAVTGELRMSIPKHQCAPRGTRVFASVRDMPVSLHDNAVLSIFETQYTAQRN